MNLAGYTLYHALLTAAALALAVWLARVYDGRLPAVLLRAEAVLLRLAGVNPERGMGWSTDAVAVRALLSMPPGILVGGAVTTTMPQATAAVRDAGPHGLNESVYACASAAGNNSPAFGCWVIPISKPVRPDDMSGLKTAAVPRCS